MKSGADVLVVEDDAEVNELIGEYLRLEGMDYRAALNGNSALQQARGQTPDLVILDLMLPDISGFEVCQTLKKDRNTVEVPILILSALADEESQKKGRACGAAEYLTKPFDPDQLLEAVSRHRRGNGQAH